VPGSKSWPLMIYAEVAHACATRQEGEIEQIQFLLGHASVQTTERYIGCKQKLDHAVNDLIEFHLG
jgi:integrase